MKNSSDYGNGPPVKIENEFDHEPRTPTGYADSPSYQSHYQINSNPHSPYTQQIQSPPQHFYPEGFQNGNNSQYSFVRYNQENNSNKLNIPNTSYRHHPYDRPNSQLSQASSCASTYLQNTTPSPSPKQCEKCGFMCDSINQLTEHVNNCHPSTTNFQNYNMLSGGEIIKTETEILDLDSYKVHQFLPEEDEIANNMQQNGMMPHQWNQPLANLNIQPEVFSPVDQRMYTSTVHDQKIFSPNIVPSQEHLEYAQEGPNVIQKSVIVDDETPPPAKGANWKSNAPRKPKTYNCVACNKWFTSSGHLKRHYNTTLHKNAVKSSGQPDPADLPVSAHHHPKSDQNRTVDKKILQHSPIREPDRPRSSNERYDLPTMSTINQANLGDPPNVQAGPSVTETRGLLSINNQMPTNQTTNNTFNNTINNGYLPPMLMPVDATYYQMHPNEITPHDSPVIIINDTTAIGREESKFPSFFSTDQSQPLPSFSQIQRFGQMAYYSDVGGQETLAYPSYNFTSLNPPQLLPYHHQNEDNRKYTLMAPPDSTSTDGDLLPIAPSVNNNNLVIGNEEAILPDIKYDVDCSSSETSNGPDIENSSPQISSTSNIVKPQPLHKCFDCDKVFNKSCYLTQHNKTFHSGDKPFKCIRCGKRFSCEQQHLEHQAKHGGEKPHKCDQCPKQFNHKTDLRRHMCLHTGKKPFICDLCGKGFIRKDHMIKHGDTHLKKPPKMSTMNNARNH